MSRTDDAISVEGLGKRYRIGQRQRYRTLRDTIRETLEAPADWFKRRRSGTDPAASEQTIWALRDVSFSVKRGEVLGVIGANGVGKSTLLKLLARITMPSEGRAIVRGRVGSLLEVGTGFHPELTGRENIYLNGAILGMRRAEIHRRFDQIVAFAGIERFLDTPVKHYSSGMYMRLGFSVAAHLLAEILLVDEVLAVGDAAFQLRCLNKMAEISQQGRTVLFVSHNMEAVVKLCGRGLLLSGGRVARLGSVQECIDLYLSTARQQQAKDGQSMSLMSHPGRTKAHNGPVRLTSLTVLDDTEQPVWSVRCGRSATILIGYEVIDETAAHGTTFSVSFCKPDNHRVTTCRSHDTLDGPIPLSAAGTVACHLPRVPLIPGLYKLNVGCYTEAGVSDGVYEAVVIEVMGQEFYPSKSMPGKTQGDVLVDHRWQVLDGAMLARLS